MHPRPGSRLPARCRSAASEPNVLTLDYLDVTAGGETKKNVYCYQACQFAFQKNGMPQNPWDSAVQFRDELITKKFPPESGCEATYRFTIEGEVPKPLGSSSSGPTCTRSPATASRSAPRRTQWWLDKSFGRIDITAAAKTGENAVTIKAVAVHDLSRIGAGLRAGRFRPETGRRRLRRSRRPRR